MRGLLTSARYTIRLLLKSPIFTIIAVLILVEDEDDAKFLRSPSVERPKRELITYVQAGIPVMDEIQPAIPQRAAVRF